MNVSELWSQDGYVYAAILLLALCSVITRAGVLLAGDRLSLSTSVRRALRYAPVAALAGILVPEILPWSAGNWPQLDERLPAVLVALAAYRLRRNALTVIVSGMLVLWLLRWLLH